MNEAEDKKLVEEIGQLYKEMNQLEEEHSKNLEEWIKEKIRLEQIVRQSAEERRNKVTEFDKEQDARKRVALWGKFDELTKKFLKADENLLDARIKYFEIARDDFEKLFRKNIEKEIKLTKRLKQLDGVEKKKEEGWLRKEMRKGSRLKKLETNHRKVLDHEKDLKKKLEIPLVELMEAIKKIEKKLKEKAGKIEELEKQGLQDEIEKRDAEIKRALGEYNQKEGERLEIEEKARKKTEDLHRVAYILNYATDDDEIYVDILVGLQEISEVTERTAEIQERIEKSQKETAEIQKGIFNQLEHLKKNTSEEQQDETAAFTVIFTTLGTAFVAIFGAISGEILGEIFGKNWVKVLVEKIGAVWTFLLVLLAVAMIFVGLFFSFPYLKKLYRKTREILSK